MVKRTMCLAAACALGLMTGYGLAQDAPYGPDSAQREGKLDPAAIRPDAMLAVSSILHVLAHEDLPGGVSIAPEALTSVAAADLRLDDFVSTVVITGYAPAEDGAEHEIAGLFGFRDLLDRRISVVFSIAFKSDGEHVEIVRADLARLFPSAPRIALLAVPASRVPEDRTAISANFGSLFGFAIANAVSPRDAALARGEMFLFAFALDWLGPQAELALRLSDAAAGESYHVAEQRAFDFDGWRATVGSYAIAPETALLSAEAVVARTAGAEPFIAAEGVASPGAAQSEIEPNDTPESATPAQFDLSMGGRLALKGDRDWYVFQTPRAGRTTFHLPPGTTISGMPVQFDLMAEGDERPTSADGVGQVTLVRDRAEKGEMRVRVSDAYEDEASDTLYRLIATFEPAADDHEPNDSDADATPLSADGETSGALFPRGDEDRYAIKTQSAGRLTVELTSWPREVPGLLPTLQIAGQTNEIWPGGEPSRLAVSVDVGEAGQTLAIVRDDFADAASPAPYRLHARLEPSADAHEPNNEAGVATAVALGSPFGGALFPKGDVDAYRLSLPAAGRLTVRVSDWPRDVPGLLPTLELKDLTREIWPGGDPVSLSAVVDIGAAGDQILFLRDDYGDAADPRAYEVLATLVPAEDANEPNDTDGAETAVPLETSFSGAIFPRGDVDRFALDVPSAGRLVLVLESWPQGGAVAPQVRLAAVSRDMMPAPDAREVELGEVTPGRYVIELRDTYDDAADPSAYRLRVSLR